MTPEARTFRRNIPPYPASAVTPSCIRAPAPSFRPMSGAPADSARSMILWIFCAWASPSEPPKIRKSWAYRNTFRPSTVPYPVITPSVGGRCSSSPNPDARCRRKISISRNEPASHRRTLGGILAGGDEDFLPEQSQVVGQLVQVRLLGLAGRRRRAVRHGQSIRGLRHSHYCSP